MISVSDFLNWKSDPVTKAFFQAAQERVEECKDVLSTSGGNNKLNIRFFVGMIHAYRELQEFRVEDFD